MKKKANLRHSESFKQMVLREVEEGKFSGCMAAANAYGIRGADTVRKWARKYGREHLTRKLIRVETAKDREEYKELKERIGALERALGDATLDLRLEREYVKLACAQAGIKDVEQFKKKPMGNGEDGGGGWGSGAAWGGERALPAGRDKSAELLCVSAGACAGGG